MVQLHIPADAPSLRLCTIVKSVADSEYGFNLHAERQRGQFVGAVDEGSVAQRAGLRSGDRIFAVNGEPIVQLSHKEVVRRIKSNSIRCELLVLDETGARWYAENGIPISPLLPNIIRTCPPRDYDMDDYDDVADDSNYYPDSGFEQESNTTPDKHHRRSRVFPASEQMVAKSPTAGNATILQYAPQPRLCKLVLTKVIQVKSVPADEFGFNLHAEHGKGHFIGAVDEGGIAQAAGLETGQRIVGVNGRLIFANTPHNEVVAFIKQNPLSTKLLVASEAVDRWHAENGVTYSYERVSVYEPPPSAGRDAIRQLFHGASDASANGGGSSATSSTASRYGARNHRRQPAAVVNGNENCRGVYDCVNVDSDPVPNTNHVEQQQHEQQEQQQNGIPTYSLPQAYAAAADNRPTLAAAPPPAEMSRYESTTRSTNDWRASGGIGEAKFAAGRDENFEFFKMSAREALRAVRLRAGAKKTNDPRLNANLSLEDKHRLIANL